MKLYVISPLKITITIIQIQGIRIFSYCVYKNINEIIFFNPKVLNNSEYSITVYTVYVVYYKLGWRYLTYECVLNYKIKMFSYIF